jgi:hypothetical protein
MDNSIKQIQAEFNSSPCVFCGKFHRVELGGKSGFVTFGFSEDACQKFKERVKAVVSIRQAGAGFPLP